MFSFLSTAFAEQFHTEPLAAGEVVIIGTTSWPKTTPGLRSSVSGLVAASICSAAGITVPLPGAVVHPTPEIPTAGAVLRRWRVCIMELQAADICRSPATAMASHNFVV